MKESIIFIVSMLYGFGALVCGAIGIAKMLEGANLESDSDYFKEGRTLFCSVLSFQLPFI